jgi:radical SAM-linked protein
VVGRGADRPSSTQREVAEAWSTAIESTDLPLARANGSQGRPRISFGAPLPAGMAAEAELIDVVLTERWPTWRVRESVVDAMPSGWRLVDLYDVWLGGPPLAGQVVAADYRISLAGLVDGGSLARAAGELLDAQEIPRERAKGAGVVRYDLRPLLIDLRADVGPPPTVLVRTRFHHELGSGRPEPEIDALGDRLGSGLEVASIVRERLVLKGDLD